MKIYKLVIILMISLYGPSVFAEGGCPPGSYPQQGNGWRACVPIPGDNSSEAPRPPSEQWVDTWGALAVTSSGQINGQATDQTTEIEAVAAAIADCKAYGGQGCTKFGTYRNQCIAIAAGNTGSRILVGKTEDEAVANAMGRCSSDNLSACHVYYSGCSLPKRIR